MKQFKYLSLFIVGIALLLSCESQLDTLEDFTAIKKKYTIGAPLSIEARTGDRKAEIKFVIPADQRISYGTIQWQDLGEDKEVRVSLERELVKVDTFKVLIEDIEEGLKNFELTLYDDEDDKSKTASVIATVYGPDYASILIPRRISEVKTGITDNPDVDKATIVWSFPLDQIQLSYLTWFDKDGVEHIDEITNDVNTTELLNFDSSTEVVVSSVILPEEDSFDEFNTGTLRYSYPVIEVMADKTLWQYVNLGNDTPLVATGWGNWASAWNGNYDDLAAVVRQFTLRPFSISLDLGVEKVLSEFSWTATADWAKPLSPREYEIWGIADITDAETTVILTPETLADWQSEMREKGWTQLIDHSHTAAEQGAVSKKIENDVKSRYVRIVVKETFAPENPDTVVGELDFKYYK